jgi:Domain of unknown function (DUF5655)/Domain of unknown function (DUF4287)
MAASRGKSEGAVNTLSPRQAK